jgi:Ser/Thr protein kinase RdoA (MazF antagonist)
MEIQHIIRQFKTSGRISRFSPYGTGHINDTYLVETESGGDKIYLLQRVNHLVFKNVPEVMENIQRVTTHIRKKLLEIPGSDPDRETLTLIETSEGKPCYRDDGGNYFRMYLFIKEHNSYDIVQNKHQAYEVGRMFGRFLDFMSDLPGEPLHETIKDFHNIEYRLHQFFESLSTDAMGRAGKIKSEIEFVEKRMDEMKILLELSRKGEIPVRVTHNDTKINNVLLDKNDKGLCIIDLDTVMPGLAHYDFGDAMRTSTNTGAEDEANLDNVEMNIDFYEAITRGFLKEMKSLTDTEIEYLPLAAKLFPYEQGVRFLTDYLDGDIYYKIKHKEHNLQRTRAQFKLLTSMERQYGEMMEIVTRISKGL